MIREYIVTASVQDDTVVTVHTISIKNLLSFNIMHCSLIEENKHIQYVTKNYFDKIMKPYCKNSTNDVKIPKGLCYSDYLYWDTVSNLWKNGTDLIHIGCDAGLISQYDFSVAIGSNSGKNNQGINRGLPPLPPPDLSCISATASSLLNIFLLNNNAVEIGRSVAIGYNSGLTDQNEHSVAIGWESGMTNQKLDSVAIGAQSGTIEQDAYAVAVGAGAGYENQQKGTVAVGWASGWKEQDIYGIAIGPEAGYQNQGSTSIAIGGVAGRNNQGKNSIAIGFGAGLSNQGECCIALGNLSGFSNQPNKSFYVSPNYVRELGTPGKPLLYDNSTGEIFYDTNIVPFQLQNTIISKHYFNYSMDANGFNAVNAPSFTNIFTLVGSEPTKTSSSGISLDNNNIVQLTGRCKVSYNAIVSDNINANSNSFIRIQLRLGSTILTSATTRAFNDTTYCCISLDWVIEDIDTGDLYFEVLCRPDNNQSGGANNMILSTFCISITNLPL